MKRLLAQTWDKMQLILRDFYDGTMHSAFYYESTLDETVLTKTIEHVVSRIPVLHSTYVNTPIAAHWCVHDDFDVKDVLTFTETDKPLEELEKFICQQVDEKGKVQIKIALIRSNGKDILAVIINHMCFDGGDLKCFNHLVAALYNEYVQMGKFTIPVKCGTRAATQVYDAMSTEDKKVATHLDDNVSAVKNATRFPFAAKDGTERTVIVRKKIDRETFGAMHAKGKSEGATVNDVLLTAYIRALYKVCSLDSSKGMSLSCMVDLRRYLEGKQTKGFTNMTGFMPYSMTDIGDSMATTMLKVQEQSAKHKQNKFLGLDSIPLLNLAYNVFPDALASLCIRIGYKNPLFSMSNIGIIEDEKMVMNGVKLEDAWYTGAVKYKPYIQLAMTTLRGEVTMSVAIRANDKDVAQAEKMLDYVVDGVKEFINA